MRRTNAELKRDNIELRERCDIVTKELSESQKDFKAIIGKYKGELVEARRGIEMKREETATLQNVIKTLQSEIERTAFERDHLKYKYEDTQVEVMKYAQKNADLNKLNATLTAKCEELEVRVTQRQSEERIKVVYPSPRAKPILHVSTGVGPLEFFGSPHEKAPRLSPPQRAEDVKEQPMGELDEYAQAQPSKEQLGSDFGAVGSRGPVMTPSGESGFDFRETPRPEEQPKPLTTDEQRAPAVAEAKAFGETPGEHISDFFISEEEPRESETKKNPFDVPEKQEAPPAAAPLSPPIYPVAGHRKHVKSVALEPAETYEREQAELSQSFYGGPEYGQSHTETMRKELEMDSNLKYRNCLSTAQCKWYEDRVLSLGLIRKVDRPTKGAEYNVYFGNKLKEFAVSIAKFDVFACDSKGNFASRESSSTAARCQQRPPGYSPGNAARRRDAPQDGRLLCPVHGRRAGVSVLFS